MKTDIRIPSADEISSLPKRAAAALAARIARRLFVNAIEQFDQAAAKEADDLLWLAESVASINSMRGWSRLYSRSQETKAFGKDLFIGAARKFELFWPKCVERTAVASALLVASEIAGAEVDLSDDTTYSRRGLADLVWICEWYVAPAMRKEIWDDFCCVRDLAVRNAWTHSTPVPPGLWALHSRFDLERLIDGRSILTISSFINERLVAYFREHPQRLYDLTPRQFEELVAEIWDGFGFEVELTSQTVDGGCDVIAVKHSPLRRKYLIECKRYRSDRTIGVHIVRQLGGVVLKHVATSRRDDEAIKGILATTSSFTSPAQTYLRDTRYWLEGADSDRIVQWLAEYDRIRMATLL